MALANAEARAKRRTVARPKQNRGMADVPRDDVSNEAVAHFFSLSPQPQTPAASSAEEGEPPTDASAAVALGRWMLVFEALGVAEETETMPRDHFLHPSRVSLQIDGWADMVVQVRAALARCDVDRQTLTHAQYNTREGRRHLLQQAVMRTAKHANLNPGDWEPFSKTLEDWLGPDCAAIAEKLLPSVGILLPAVSSPTTFSPSAIFTPSARSVSARPNQSAAALTPRNLTPEETARMASSKLQAEVLVLREYKAKREAADKAEDSTIVLYALRKKLESLRRELATHPAEARQQLGRDEDEWRKQRSDSAAAAREAMLAAHATGHTQQTEEQAELLRHMNDYIEKIVADVPDGKLQVEVEEHNALVATLHSRRENMVAEHDIAKANLAAAQREENEQLQRDEKAGQVALAEQITTKRSELEQSLDEWGVARTKDISDLESDIAQLLATCGELRKRWLSAPDDPASPRYTVDEVHEAVATADSVFRGERPYSKELTLPVHELQAESYIAAAIEAEAGKVAEPEPEPEPLVGEEDQQGFTADAPSDTSADAAAAGAADDGDSEGEGGGGAGGGGSGSASGTMHVL